MKAVMLSVNPKWCELIASGKKTIDVRKTKPKIKPPFKCYIYCTKEGRPLVYGSPVPSYVEENLVQTYGYSREEADRIFGIYNGKVIGEFVCGSITMEAGNGYKNRKMGYHVLAEGSCLSLDALMDYGKMKILYGWHIFDFTIYEEPKELSEFYIIDKNQDCDDCRNFNIFHENEPCNQCDRGRKYLSRPPQSWCYVEEATP